MKYRFCKLTLFCTIITLTIIVYTSIRDMLNTTFIPYYRRMTFKVDEQTSIENTAKDDTRTVNSLKYILQWTSDENVPFVYMGKGQKGFTTRNCSHTNCFVTSNRSYLGDYTKFDVIAFAGPEWNWFKKPKRRSPLQKYVFASIEASSNYPICTNKYDGFFNWTWSYKLESEVHWGYIVIRDLQNNIIGPKVNMNWLKPHEMMSVSEDFKNKLKTKRKAAAWFASNCITVSRREEFVGKLHLELSKYQCMDSHCGVDVYGNCGLLVCSRDHEEQCDKNIEITYFFYLAFENAFSDDYVTEKLLRALKNNAIPIVYGGANYSRFMPDGAYLNAKELGVKKLAAKMLELINNPEEYATYFKWQNHYRYHRTMETVETNEYCRFCALLNDEASVREVSVYRNFREWWNTPDVC